MTRAEFLAAFAGKSAAAWENAVIDLARKGEIVRWPLADVTIHHPTDGRAITFRVATDYIAVGEPDDALRVPLTPGAMQRVADAFAMVLPTAPMVKAIHEQAPVKLSTQGLVPNKGADLAQYEAHDAKIRAELAGLPSADPSLLRSGHKKDVVLAGPALLKPRVVLIYGWMNRGPVPGGLDPAPLAGQPWRTQPLSNVHGDFYVDYSHGGRLVHPEAILHEADGSERVIRLADAYQDASLAAILNPGRPEWGAGVLAARYPVPNAGSPIAYVPVTPGLADRGLSEIKERTLERFGSLPPKSGS